MHATVAGRFEERPNEVNISPLIDMVFILLIFFIVTTVFVNESGTQVTGPRNESPEETPPLVFTLTPQGGILSEGRSIAIAGVAAMVRKTAATEPTAVVLEVQPDVVSQQVVSVIDVARSAGARDVGLVSAP